MKQMRTHSAKVQVQTYYVQLLIKGKEFVGYAIVL